MDAAYHPAGPASWSADDMHSMGGALLSDNLAEAGTMFACATCPPDPAVVGERRREIGGGRL